MTNSIASINVSLFLYPINPDLLPTGINFASCRRFVMTEFVVDGNRRRCRRLCRQSGRWRTNGNSIQSINQPTNQQTSYTARTMQCRKKVRKQQGFGLCMTSAEHIGRVLPILWRACGKQTQERSSQPSPQQPISPLDEWVHQGRGVELSSIAPMTFDIIGRTERNDQCRVRRIAVRRRRIQVVMLVKNGFGSPRQSEVCSSSSVRHN